MPKRRRDHIATILDNPIEQGTDTRSNHAATGNSDLPNAGTNQQAQCTGASQDKPQGQITALEWHQKNNQSSVPLVIPGANLIQQQKEKQLKADLLQRMVDHLPQAKRQYTTSAIEQWKGLVPPVEDIICTAISLGISRKSAASLTGTSLYQLKEWLTLGAKGFSPFANFRLRFLQAEAMSEVHSQLRVEEAASIESKSAQVYFKLLERQFPIGQAETEDATDNIPIDQFTTEELVEYLNSNGKVIPSRFSSFVEGEEILGSDDENIRLELAKLKEENRLLALKLELSNERSS